jgi:A/G-specific adenine glycosylase
MATTQGRCNSISPGRFADEKTRHTINRKLLTWFRRHQRDLPWRHSRDPYRIWVSEVMLQQTQVVSVIRYFTRFLERFPTVGALAAASEAEVLRLWEGLGYYRRARDLHRAARQLVSEGHTQVPDDPEVVAELPGVGRYILGALLSQAFDRRLPILEANSERVMCRLFGVRGNPKSGPIRARLWHLAEALLPKRAVGDFNQSLMELGALVCTAAEPRCDDCPVAAVCRARQRQWQHLIPQTTIRPATVPSEEVTVVIYRANHVLLAQRPEHSRWAGMWEFPRGSVARGESLESSAKRIARELAGITVDEVCRQRTIIHAVNHHRITLTCYEARRRDGRFQSDFYVRGQWVLPTDLSRYPMCVPQRRMARSVFSTSAE